MTTDTLAADVVRATATIAAARRAIVVPAAGCDAATTVAACDLAEALGAALDCGHAETAQVAGPTIARIGAVTADPGELRDRADLVVFWFCDPASHAPEFLRRFVTSATSGGRPRHTIAVGPDDVATSAASDRHLTVDAADAIALARLLHAAVAGHANPAPPAAFAAVRGALAAAIGSAGCVAFVTHHQDPVGLEPWSLVGLVRAIAHHKPAFEVPLHPAGPAAEVCTWRYGAAGAIARADRAGAAFRPAECDAVRLIGRREVDCVVLVGPPADAVDRALAARGDSLPVIRITGTDAAMRSRLAALLAAVRSPRATGVGP